jgi:phosphate-selective porin
MNPIARLGAAVVGALLLTLSVSAADAPATVAPAAKPTAIRIKTGITAPLKDETGVTWEADRGFADGDTVEREDAQIANTKTPSVYRAERYGMSAFSVPVPNGKYTVKLHFAETYEGITDAGQRVFDFKVGDKEFKNFDVFKLAGGANKAYVETVPVEVKNGKLDITFTAVVENPEINGIEIIPAQ